VQGIQGFHIGVQLRGVKNNPLMKFFNLSGHFLNSGVPFIVVIPLVFSEQQLKMSPH